MTRETPEFITPLSITFPLGLAPSAVDVTITAADVGQLGRLLKLATPVLADLAALPADTLERLVSEEGPTHTDVMVLLELLGEQPETAFQFVAIAARMQQAAVEALPPDQFAYLFAVVVQVNADFFARARSVFSAAAGKFGALKVAKADSTTGPAFSAS